jgi:hypothetical protein
MPAVSSDSHRGARRAQDVLTRTAAEAVVRALQSRVSFTLEPRLRRWLTGGEPGEEARWKDRLHESAELLAEATPDGIADAQTVLWQARLSWRLKRLDEGERDAASAELRLLVDAMARRDEPYVVAPHDESFESDADRSPPSRFPRDDHPVGETPGHIPPGPPIDDSDWDD